MECIEYVSEIGYKRIQDFVTKYGIMKTLFPIDGTFYLLFIDYDEIKALMPYKGNEWVQIAGDKPRLASRNYFNREGFNEALNTLKPCPYHFFGAHDICCDDICDCKVEEICAICLNSDPLTKLVPLMCNHFFHKKCLNSYALKLRETSFSSQVDVQCPTCKFLVNRLDNKFPDLADLDDLDD